MWEPCLSGDFVHIKPRSRVEMPLERCWKEPSFGASLAAIWTACWLHLLYQDKGVRVHRYFFATLWVISIHQPGSFKKRHLAGRFGWSFPFVLHKTAAGNWGLSPAKPQWWRREEKSRSHSWSCEWWTCLKWVQWMMHKEVSTLTCWAATHTNS